LVYGLPSTALTTYQKSPCKLPELSPLLRHDVNAYINLRNGFTRRYNLVNDGILFVYFFTKPLQNPMKHRCEHK